MTASPRCVLVIGGGSAGRRHLRNCRTLFPHARLISWRVSGRPGDEELAALCDRVVLDEAAAIAEAPDMAVVAGPASTHVSTALVFANRGVPLLVEKPLSTDLDSADQLIDACAKSGAILLVGYTLRFHPLLTRLDTEIASGVIGRPVGVQAEVGQYLPDWRPGMDWRQCVTAHADRGGGAILELSHEFDYLEWILGRIATLAAFSGSLGLGLAVEDYVEIVLQFSSGAIGNVHMDLLQRPGSRRCRVFGDRGALDLDFNRLALCRTDAHGVCETIADAEGFERNTMFIDELRHFSDCVAGRTEPRVSGATGRRVLEIALAVRRAAEQRVIAYV